MNPHFQQELKEVIQDWLVRNPGSHSTGYIPFHQFAREAGKYFPSRGVQPGSIFSLLFLDPLAGLDPTRRAIDESRGIGVGAEQLTSLLSSLEERSPQMNLVLSQARNYGEQWTDHIFRRGWLLGSLLIVQILLALLAYRYLVERLIRKREPPGGPSKSC